MEQVKYFFDTSTIHGLSWISSTRRVARYFWILVVIASFIFDMVKMDGDLYSIIEIIPPRKYEWDYSGKIRIVLKAEKNAMSSLEFERLELFANKNEVIDAGLEHITRNFSKIKELKITYKRKPINQKSSSSQFDMMPGFRLTWFYNSQMEPINKFGNDLKTKSFIR